ncbi:hypothetical protein LEMLEM_LOCUS21642 [Lemmus lemmus]
MPGQLRGAESASAAVIPGGLQIELLKREDLLSSSESNPKSV